jgi:transposase
MLDKAIEQIFELIPNTLTSIKGIGPVYFAGIIAEIGDINRFQSHASVAKYAGLVWNKNQSGDFEGRTFPLYQVRQPFLSLLPAGRRQLSEKMRLGVQALL